MKGDANQKINIASLVVLFTLTRRIKRRPHASHHKLRLHKQHIYIEKKSKDQVLVFNSIHWMG
jgi:hypothetical protein